LARESVVEGQGERGDKLEREEEGRRGGEGRKQFISFLYFFPP
jgi:hypothetical protein